MASVMEIMQLCRLCLVKDQVNIPIFEEQGDIRQIFLKISACLPVKVSREDNLPKKICDGCSYKLEILYQFWNTSANSEKQLLKWLNQVGIEKTTPTSDKVAVASVKVQPHSINSDNVVLKQEVVDLGDSHGAEDDDDDDGLDADDLNVSNDAQDYILQQQQLPYQPVTFEFQEGFTEGEATSSTAGPSATITSEAAEVAPKRKRRAAAMKALPPHIDSEEEDDDVDLVETKIAKTEEQSDDSAGEDPEPTTFVGLPSTSTDNEQPGPSGVGKGAVEAPLCRQRKTKLRKAKIATTTKISSYKKDLYKLMFNSYKKKYNLKPCLVLLGNIKNLDTKEFVPSKKLRRYLNKSHVTNINSKDNILCNNSTRLKVDKNVKTHKSSFKVVNKCKLVINKPIFEKNFVISDDSDTEDDRIRSEPNKKLPEVIKQSENTHLENSDVSITSSDGGVEVIPENLTNGEFNKNYTEKNMSIIELAFAKALSSTDKEVPVQNSTVKETLSFSGQKSQPDNNHPAENVLHIFGNTITQKYNCTECKESFDDSFKLKRHTMVHKMKLDKAIEKRPTLSCYLCMRKFYDRNSLWSHMRTHAMKTSSPFKCKNCNQEFRASRDLSVHKTDCGGSKQGSTNTNVAAASRSIFSETALKYRCSICKRKFADVLQMRRHKKIHNSNASSVNEEKGVVAVTSSPRTAVLLDKIITTTAANSKKVQNTAAASTSSNSVEKIINNKWKEKEKSAPTSSNSVETRIFNNAKQDSVDQKTKENSNKNMIPLNSAAETELKPKFKCCQQIFSERNQLFLHMKEQNSMPNGIINCDPTYCCNICWSEFSTRLGWFVHCKTRHKNYYAAQKIANKSIVKMRKPRYACGTCYMKFDSISKLKEHKFDKHMSIATLQKTSPNDPRVKINDLKIEFERLFCARTTKEPNQEDVVADDDYDEEIIIENNVSDILETPQTDDCDLKLVKPEEEEKPELSLANAVLSTDPPEKVKIYRCDICDDVFQDNEEFLEHQAFHKEFEMPNNETTPEKSLDMPNLFLLLKRVDQKNHISNVSKPSQDEAAINHNNIIEEKTNVLSSELEKNIKGSTPTNSGLTNANLNLNIFTQPQTGVLSQNLENRESITNEILNLVSTVAAVPGVVKLSTTNTIPFMISDVRSLKKDVAKTTTGLQEVPVHQAVLVSSPSLLPVANSNKVLTGTQTSVGRLRKLLCKTVSNNSGLSLNNLTSSKSDAKKSNMSQPVLVENVINANQPESNPKIVTDPPGNYVTDYPRLATLLTEKVDPYSLLPSKTPSTLRKRNKRAHSINVTSIPDKTLPATGKSIKEKIEKSKLNLKQLKKLFAQSTRTFAEAPTVNEIIELSDNSNDEVVNLQADTQTEIVLDLAADENKDSSSGDQTYLGDSNQNLAVQQKEPQESLPPVISQTPRIFVRNMNDLLDPKCLPLNTDNQQQSAVGNHLRGNNHPDKDFANASISLINERVSSPENGQEQAAKSKLPKFVPMKCGDCNALFKKQRSYRRHERVHRFKFCCRKCDYHTCSKHCIKIHYRQHQSEYLCCYCMLECDSQEQLFTHTEVHRCPKCCHTVENVIAHLERCNKINTTRDLKQPPSTNNQIEQNNSTQVASKWPALYDELPCIENTTVFPDDYSENPLVIDEGL